MQALTLERSASISASWLDQEENFASRGYRVGSTSSKDFGTGAIGRLQAKVIVLSDYQMLINRAESFGQSSTAQTKAIPPMTVDVSIHHPDLARAEKRLAYLKQLDLTESFEELTPPSKETMREAGLLLRKFAALGGQAYLPFLGMDSDGTIVFSFHPDRGGLIGSLSVFGDGTYSYCIEKEGVTVESGAASIAGPIATDLRDFLVE